VFNLLTSGAVDDTAGRVDDFGGGTMDGSVGVKPNWARLGYVAFQGTAQGPVTFNVQPGSLQFSRFGAGNVPWSEVDFDTLTLEQRTPVPEISVADTRLTEGTDGMTNAVFAVILSAGSTETVTVRYATADGTAMERRRDYISRSGSLTFKPGETSKAIQIAVIGDEIHEADQTFYVNLTDATNATISDGQGLGTILDDESDSRTLRNRDVQDYEDADNDWFRLEYRGSGEAEVAFADDGQYGADIAAIAFTGATSGTKLTSTLVEPGKDGQGRTTIESIEAVGQSLGTLDFSLETRGAAIQNQTSLMGSVEIGGRMSKFAFGGDVLGDVQIGGPVTNVIIGGALDGQFSAVGTITKAVAGSLGENARLSSAEGSILALTTVGDMDGEVAAAQHLGTLRAGGGIGATLQAELDIRSVFSAGDITADGGFTARRDIKKVETAGRLATSLKAGRHIGTVKAAAIDGGQDGIRLVAGSDGDEKADVGTVQVGAGGIVSAEIQATRYVKKVTTAGRLEDAVIIAGLDPGPDGEWAKHPPKGTTDDVPNQKARISTVTASQYVGDVRVMTGGKSLGRYTIGGTRRNASEATPNAVTGPNFLTLVRTVNGVSTVV